MAPEAQDLDRRLPRLEARLVELHPYSVPQVVALPVEAAYGGYEEWALEQLAA